MTTGTALLVVGGGPAGVTAALQAREAGADVTLLEADQVGGTTLNRGPAPVRTLARAARLMRDWSSWADFGLEGPRPIPHLEAILANSARVARYAHDKKHMATRLRHHGIDLVESLGPVHFTDPHTLRGWRPSQLAGGSHHRRRGRSRRPAADSRGGAGPHLRRHPRPDRAATAAAVIGAADTGCQIASILADLGVSVRLFEAGPALCPTRTPASPPNWTGRSAAGHSTHTRAGQSLDRRGDRVRSSGPTPNGCLQLDGRDGRRRGILRRRLAGQRRHWPSRPPASPRSGSAIPVDSFLRTNVGHIFAAGDVNGHPCSSRWLGSRAGSPPRTPCRGPPARSTTTWCPAPVSPTRNTARSV